jgi:hypothetical protein
VPEKWSINRLYTETDFDRRTIKRWLDSADKAPVDVDGKTEFYSLRDFIDAAIESARPSGGDGGENPELTRKTRIQADILEIEKAKLNLTVLDTEEIFRVLENRDIALRRVIITSELPDATKDKILNDLRSIDINDILAERSVSAGLAAASQ